MKKFLFSILAIIYIVASTGATMHLHYCMGRLADTGFFEQEGGHCSLCGMEKSNDEDDNGCCTDQEETVKISIDQKFSAASVFHFEQPFTDIVAVFTGFQPSLDVRTDDKVPPVSHAPPRSPQVPPYLMHCHFSI
jgi:hypothetical protein